MIGSTVHTKRTHTNTNAHVRARPHPPLHILLTLSHTSGRNCVPVRRTKFSRQFALDLANCSLSENRREEMRRRNGQDGCTSAYVLQLCVIVHLANNICVFLCVCVCVCVYVCACVCVCVYIHAADTPLPLPLSYTATF